MSAPFLAVTLDLDGTLLDTVPDLAAAVNATRQDLGLPALERDEVAARVGRGIADLVARCLPELAAAAHSAAEAVFRAHYARSNGRHTRIYPGVREALAAFAGLGLPMAVVTNKAACFSEPLLDGLGLGDAFVCVVSGDTTAHKKPHPEPLLHACARLGVAPQRTLHIGDSRHDFECARAAGCAVALVSCGYHGGEQLAALGADRLAADLAEIAAWVRSRHGSARDNRL